MRKKENAEAKKKKKESEKVGLKLNIQKPKIMASGPITSWQIDDVRKGYREAQGGKPCSQEAAGRAGTAAGRAAGGTQKNQ